VPFFLSAWLLLNSLRISWGNQCNQSELSPQPESAPGRDSQNGVPSDNETPKKELGVTPVVNKARCPHHPHARWVRFDPSGQAWCDKMDCWDCYRLMKIGEALVYPHLQGSTRSTTIDQGKAAWASFVFSQGSFVVMTATEQAITMCKKLGVAVPDLSGEEGRELPQASLRRRSTAASSSFASPHLRMSW
jgi:hypothetical protein